jgi:hypothetical protein
MSKDWLGMTHLHLAQCMLEPEGMDGLRFDMGSEVI